jgi:hypothetical protein
MAHFTLVKGKTSNEEDMGVQSKLAFRSKIG